MRALVTGAPGFVGQWLCRELLGRGWEVTGTTHGEAPRSATLAPEEAALVRWVPADVRRAEDLRRALSESSPDAIFHLAGVTFVPAAGADPGAAVEVNVAAVARLLAEVRDRRAGGGTDPAVLVVGSALQYGRHGPDAMPLREDVEQRPLDLYGASKAAQEVIALAAFRADSVRVIATRSFNHSGPGQSEQFLLPRLVRRALDLRAAGRGTLTLGNLTPVRDFLHVADVVRAYVLLAGRGVPGEAYNVASGVGVDVRTLAERVLALAGVDAKLQTDPSLQRAADVPLLVGDPGKLRAATGWAPQRTTDSIVDDLIRAASP